MDNKARQKGKMKRKRLTRKRKRRHQSAELWRPHFQIAPRPKSVDKINTTLVTEETEEEKKENSSETSSVIDSFLSQPDQFRMRMAQFDERNPSQDQRRYSHVRARSENAAQNVNISEVESFCETLSEKARLHQPKSRDEEEHESEHSQTFPSAHTDRLSLESEQGENEPQQEEEKPDYHDEMQEESGEEESEAEEQAQESQSEIGEDQYNQLQQQQAEYFQEIETNQEYTVNCIGFKEAE